MIPQSDSAPLYHKDSTNLMVQGEQSQSVYFILGNCQVLQCSQPLLAILSPQLRLLDLD